MKFHLDKEQFRLWLREYSGRDFTPISSDYCPIACYLFSTFKHGFLVDGERAWYWGKGYLLPQWTKQFILKVDSCPGDRISAQKCLELLAECP